MNHISKSILHSDTQTNNWCSDMESFSIAQACFIFHKPFMGFYFVSSSDYDGNDDYDPKNIEKQTKDTILPLSMKFIECL